MINYLLETYITDDVIAKLDAEIFRFPQLSNMTLTEYAEALWNKALRCYLLYDEYVLERLLWEDYMDTSDITCVRTGV